MTTEVKNNVVSINRSISTETLTTIEQSLLAAKSNIAVFCNEATEFIMEQALQAFTVFGIDPESVKISEKEILLLELAIAAITYKYHGIHHPMQDVAEQVVKFSPSDVEDEEEEDEAVEDDDDLLQAIED